MTSTAADRPRPGPARSLSREQIAAVGLDIMSREGLGAVSLRTIALRLGVDHKALYTYVKDKDELLASMFDAAWATLDLPEANDARPANEQVIEIFRSIRRLLVSNSDLLRLIRPSTVPGLDLHYFELMWANLRSIAQDDAEAARLYTRLVAATIGSAFTSPESTRYANVEKQEIETLDRGTYAFLKPFADAFAQLDHEAVFADTLRDMLRRP